jgi:hypothetical protein
MESRRASGLMPLGRPAFLGSFRDKSDAAAIHDDKTGNPVAPSSLSQDRQARPNSRIALTSPPSVRQTAVDVTDARQVP